MTSDIPPRSGGSDLVAAAEDRAAVIDLSTVAETTSDSPISAAEAYRKLLHMLPGLFPFLLGLIPHPDPLDSFSIGLVVVICVVFSGLFLAQHRVLRRDGESDLVLTVVSYPACIVLTLLLFPAYTEFAVVVVSVLAFGDGSAYLGGKLIGGPRLPWNPDKSVAGMLAFVLVAGPMASLAYWNEARTPDGQAVPLLLAVLCGGMAAVVGAIAESWPTRITDNLRVGVAASVAVVVTHFALAGYFLA